MTVELICYFARHNDYHHFRIEELESLSEMFGWPAVNLWELEPRPESDSDDILCRVVLPSIEVAESIAKRSLLIRAFIEPWSIGTTLSECVTNMANHDASIRRKYCNPDNSFCFQVETYGCHILQEDKLQRMEMFKDFFVGDEKIDCKNPESTIFIVEEFGHKNFTGATRRVVFGRLVCRGRPDKNGWWVKYNLPQRPVLGPTTLDHELAFLMCNQAHVRPGSLVMDPYYGTGSIMVSATHMGAIAMGTEIDMRVLQGWGIAYLNKGIKHKKSQSKCYRGNYKHYGLPLPEVMRADNAAAPWKFPLLSDEQDARRKTDEATGLTTRRLRIEGFEGVRPWVDAILSDPPYGIRAGVRQGGHLQSNKKTVTDADGQKFGGEGAWREALKKSREARGGLSKKEYLAQKEARRQAFRDGTATFERTEEDESPSTEDASPAPEKKSLDPLAIKEAEEELRQARQNRLAEAQATALDLMDMASRLLVDNGRLCFLLPVDLAAEKDQANTFARQAVDLRKDELELVGLSVEPLAAGMGRYLVTMRRIPRTKPVPEEIPEVEDNSCARCCF